jgi:thymidine phosphorylase
MLVVGRRCRTREQALPLLERALEDGTALARFRKLVSLQGGDPRVVDDPTRLPRSKARRTLNAGRGGYVSAIDAHALGLLAIELGAGRTRADQRIDPAAGFELPAPVGTKVSAASPLIVVHAASAAKIRAVEERVLAAFTLTRAAPRRRALVLERLR